jgi:hypothetical protein
LSRFAANFQRNLVSCDRLRGNWPTRGHPRAAISRKQKLRTRAGTSPQKNAISLKEMRETVYWLRVILRCELAPAEIVQPLLTEANELTAMLTSGMKRLRPVLSSKF